MFYINFFHVHEVKYKTYYQLLYTIIINPFCVYLVSNLDNVSTTVVTQVIPDVDLGGILKEIDDNATSVNKVEMHSFLAQISI